MKQQKITKGTSYIIVKLEYKIGEPMKGEE